MGSWGLGVKRALARTPVLLSIAAVVAIISGFLVGGAGYLQLAGTGIARDAITSVAPKDAAVRFETALATDATAQNLRVVADVRRGIAPVAHEVTRTVLAPPAAATVDGATLTAGSKPAEIVLGADAQVRGASVLVDGAWPTSGSGHGDVVEGALQSSAARALGVGVGAVIVTEGGPRVRIAAIWKPKNADAPRWFASLASTGSMRDDATDLRAYGPLIVPDSALPPDDSTAQWTVTVDAGQLSAEDLPTIAAFSRTTTRALEADTAATDGSVDTGGGLSRTAAAIAAELRTIVGITPIGTILLGIIALATLLQLATLLVSTRRPESVLLRSRGASVARIVGGAAIDSSIAGMVGTVVGVGAATGVLALTIGRVSPDWLQAVGIALVVPVIFSSVALVDARRLTRCDSIDDAGRGRSTATIAAMVLVVAGAAFAIFQLRLYGTPLIVSPRGVDRVDPVAVSAPAIAILAVALIIVVLFRPAASTALRSTKSRRGLAPFLSLAQVVRRSGSFAVVVLLLAATVASTVYLGALQSTAGALGERAGSLRLGAPVRVTPRTVDALWPHDFAKASGVRAAAVGSERIEIDDFIGQLVALTEVGMRTVMSDVDGSVDPQLLARRLGAANPIGIALPKSATSLDVTLSGSAALAEGFDPGVYQAAALRASLWLMDDDGVVVQRQLIPLDLASGAVAATSSVPLPPTTGRWRVIAADLTSESNGIFVVAASLEGFAVQVDGATVAVPKPTVPWTVQGGEQSRRFVESRLAGQIGATIQSDGTGDVRLMPASTPSAGAIDDPPAPLPIAVTASLARAFDLSPGKRIDIVLSDTGQSMPTVVRAVTPVVPGSTAGYSVLTDLTTYTENVLRSGAAPTGIDQVWLRADTAELPVIRRIAGSAEVQSAGGGATPAAEAAIVALWIAGVGAALLALGAVVAAAIILRRQRLPETRALSSVGVSLRTQRRGRRAELLAVAGFAVLLGAAGGLAVAALTAVPIARSVVPDSSALPAPLGIALLPTLPLLGGLLIGVLLIAALSTGRLRKGPPR
ncbi:FtsX-like permease family protein [Lacisediminihabitans changchengi]|uniref:FtsX-like permease family protein n=1 Tax=Lacisediminihabitans changchengi TaxID=2787634 RepID=A0A934SKE1_9MICO|nr:FtsX-like permease family protein [Lacisediminihabitans changchengi]MBK4348307.1 hypothetical protein [Lacisediminihabitans changchengi]